MNNTIDFNAAKTIGTMSKKIDHIDDTVSGFFSFMHMVIDLFASVVQDDHMVLPTVSIAGSFQRQKAHQKS